ncbi:10869_t:CDS:10 [Paraglomus occultum]|uniref:10869_t:CDS:1 n=1 Tax=Paraglomus occultum TaxID=144539 RepID=A0A9N9AJ54_9GLOM|nr:10869_t:CDS:10 [Paraglomus occultum]
MSANTEINERRYRPIYEALDAANYKAALQRCSKLLKKQPDLLVVKALKALALEKTGKTDEAIELCAQIKALKPVDEAVLQALSLVYRSADKQQAVVELYQTALKQKPNSEEFGYHWFIALVRIHDYRGQQQAALKLYKTFKSNRYYFWAVTSILLQADEADAQQKDLLLSLSERMIAKAIEEKRLSTSEEFYLYLVSLIRQNKTKEALEILEGELGQKFQNDIEIKSIKNTVLKKEKAWEKLLLISEEAVSTVNNDDWLSYLTYIEAVLEISSIETDDNATSSRIEKAREFISKIQEKELSRLENEPARKYLHRGPFLAELRLEKQIASIERYNSKDLSPLILKYFSKFSSKACCFEDLQPYLDGLGTEAAEKLVNEFKSCIDESSQETKDKINNVQRWVNIYKLERYLGLLSALDEKQLISYANALWKAYCDSLPLGTNLKETELHYGDDFAVLATHVLLDLHKKSGSNIYLFQAVMILETALENSPSNFQFSLLLTRIYLMLGICFRPIQLFKSLEVKHVQWDTLSHFVLNRATSLGFYDDAQSILCDALHIYQSNTDETPDMIVFAYKNGTYSKVEEFIEFEKRLMKSIQHAIIDRELMRIELFDVSNSIAQVNGYLNEFEDEDNLVPELVDKEPVGEFSESEFLAEYQMLRTILMVRYSIFDTAADDSINDKYDNRDFDVMSNFNPKGTPSVEESTRFAPKLDVTWLRTFEIIPRLLKCICLGASVDKVRRHIEMLVACCKEASLTKEEISIATILAKLGEIYCLLKDEEAGTEDVKKNLNDCISKLIQHLEDAVPTGMLDDAIESLSWRHISQASCFAEVVNYLVITLSSFKALTQSGGKKSKLRQLHPVIQSLIESVKSKFFERQDLFDAFEKRLIPEDMIEKIYPLLLSQDSIEFCRLQSNSEFVKDKLTAVVVSWGVSVLNIKKMIEKTCARF